MRVAHACVLSHPLLPYIPETGGMGCEQGHRVEENRASVLRSSVWWGDRPDSSLWCGKALRRKGVAVFLQEAEMGSGWSGGKLPQEVDSCIRH